MSLFVMALGGHINRDHVVRVRPDKLRGDDWLIATLTNGEEMPVRGCEMEFNPRPAPLPNMDPDARVLAAYRCTDGTVQVLDRHRVIGWQYTGLYEWMPIVANGLYTASDACGEALLCDDGRVTALDIDEGYGDTYDSEQTWLKSLELPKEAT